MNQDIYADVGQILKKHRKKKGLTHTELGALVGLSRPSVMRIESGKKKIYLHELGKLLAAVELTFSQLEDELATIDIKVKIESQALSKSDQATLLKTLERFL